MIVTVQRERIPPVTSVTLNLSSWEAEFLTRLLKDVVHGWGVDRLWGGESRRAHAKQMVDAIDRAYHYIPQINSDGGEK